jgi:ribonucleotide reductase alpha subunit/intein/homing endonuclease
MARFTTQAIQILEQRYLKKDKEGKVVESPDEMLERVAKHIAKNEKNAERWEKKFLEIMDNLEFLPNSPTLMNSNSRTGQLSACLSGDTIIRTCAGDFTIKELAEKYDKKERFDVYSISKGFIKIGKAFNPRKTKKNAKIYKVSFDDGSNIKATEDHLIMNRDGSYCRVDKLKEGQSVMPFNHFYNNGYLGFYLKIDTHPVMAHKFVYTFLNKDNIRKEEVIHHKNYIKTDNTVGNLQKMIKQEHFIWHSQHMKEFNPMYKEEAKQKISERMKVSNPMKNKEISTKVGIKNKISLLGNTNTKKVERETRKCILCNSEFICKVASTKKLCSKKCTAINNSGFKKGCGKGNLNVNFGSGKFVGTPAWAMRAPYNHKVVSVEFAGYEDVYDLSVEKYHNFIANNVFVHNCFVLPVEDDLAAIFEVVKESALIHKTGGGTGFNFSKLRPRNSIVNSTSGVASGPVSFMYAFDAVTETVKQGGVRRGANLGLLNVTHPDILEFINCKKDVTKYNNFNISVGMTGKFLDITRNGRKHWLVNPSNHEDRKSVDAGDLFTLICNNIWENGEPGAIFLDTINAKNPIPWMGKIDSTNPCGEQPLLPWESCNLGSIDVSKFVNSKGEINWERLGKTVEVAVRFLDNVIDVNKYPRIKIARKTLATRKIGLGLMGWADMLLMMKIRYDSEEALKLADKLMFLINDIAHNVSEQLGEEKGLFPAHNGVFKRRNATLTTIAPTGTLSMLADCSSSIEPVFAKKFTKTVLGNVTLDISKKYQKLEGDYFVTALEIAPDWHVKMQAAFQKHVDNAVSKTINLPHESTIQDIKNAMYLAYELGCKGVTMYRQGTREAPIQITTDGLSECEGDKCLI